MIKILHVKLFFVIIQLPDTIYSDSRVLHRYRWRGRGRRVKHISGYNPTGDRLEPATGYCSPARGIFLAGATAESGGQVPPGSGDSG